MEAHLPPIVSALEGTEFDWVIEVEDENPGLFRVTNCQNLQGAGVEQVIVPVLRRAYRLATEWKISGLEDLAAGELRHVYGAWSIRKPSNKPPSLESMVFGRILASAGGSWRVVDERAPSASPKPGQLRRPKQRDGGK